MALGGDLGELIKSAITSATSSGLEEFKHRVYEGSDTEANFLLREEPPSAIPLIRDNKDLIITDDGVSIVCDILDNAPIKVWDSYIGFPVYGAAPAPPVDFAIATNLISTNAAFQVETTGAGTYDVGTVVNITATSSSSAFVFSHWSPNTAIADASASSTTVTISSSTQAIIANFTYPTEEITSGNQDFHGRDSAGANGQGWFRFDPSTGWESKTTVYQDSGGFSGASGWQVGNAYSGANQSRSYVIIPDHLNGLTWPMVHMVGNHSSSFWYVLWDYSDTYADVADVTSAPAGWLTNNVTFNARGEYNKYIGNATYEIPYNQQGG